MNHCQNFKDPYPEFRKCHPNFLQIVSSGHSGCNSVCNGNLGGGIICVPETVVYCIVFCNRHQICISKLSPFALGAVHKRCHQSVGKGASKLYRFAVIIIRCQLSCTICA